MIQSNCPLCKTKIVKSDILAFGGKDRQSKPKQIVASSSSTKKQPDSNVIAATPLLGSYGTKLDSIIKHVKYLRMVDQTVKVIVFSQWQQVLGILENGFRANGIGCVDLNGKGKKKAKIEFAEREDIAVFILHSMNQSAGLTLIDVCTFYFIILGDSLFYCRALDGRERRTTSYKSDTQDWTN